MPKTSAGLLMYRMQGGELQVLLVHPGGPFFRKKDAGSWSIPKGELADDEDALSAAQREFEEETGLAASGPFLELSSVTQKSGKVVRAWAFAGDCDPARVRSNTFTMEWPPRSGVMREFPEIDRAEFFCIALAKEKINPAQAPLVEELQTKLQEARSSTRTTPAPPRRR